MLGLSHSISVLVFILFDYGNNISGLRSTARSINNHKVVSKNLSNIYLIKLIFAIVIILVILCLIFVLSDKMLKYVIPAIILGAITGLNPVWHYTAKENLNNYSIISIISKIIGLSLIIFFVKEPNHGWIVLIIQLLVNFFLCIYLLIPLFIQFSWVMPTLKEMKESLAFFTPAFLFSFFSSFHSSASMFILNLYVGPASIAYYNGAEKIQKFFMGLISPAEKALLPAAFKNSNDKKIRKKIEIKSLIALGTIGTISCFIIFIFSEKLVLMILGKKYGFSAEILKILSIQLPLTAINRIVGIQRFFSANRDVLLTKIVIIVGIINLITISIVLPKSGVIGICYTIIATEIIFLSIFTFYNKFNL